jgi:SAM-dependent methyltransferase
MAESERVVEITTEDLNLIQQLLNQNPSFLLQISEVQMILAQARLKRVTTAKTYQHGGDNLITNAIEHNMDGLLSGSALGRPRQLLSPLRSIDEISTRMSTAKVLSIGPRSEMEIFALMAIGFSIEHIRALDLIQTSPLVDLGDMHAMPYQDNFFDVIVAGWVLPYSKNLPQAISEICRVAKDDAIIAVGCEYNPTSTEDLIAAGSKLKDDFPRFYHTDEILALFGSKVGHVFFRHDVHPLRKDKMGAVMTIFRLSKAQ